MRISQRNRCTQNDDSPSVDAHKKISYPPQEGQIYRYFPTLQLELCSEKEE